MDSDLTTASGLATLGGLLVAANAIIVPLRFYARHKQSAAIKTDDWMATLSFVFFVANAACSWYGLKHRLMGYHTPSNPNIVLDQMETRIKLYLISVTFSILSLGCTKLSALFFFLRIFRSVHRYGFFDYMTFFGIAVVSLWTVGFAVATYFQCGTHFSVNWTVDTDLRLKYCSPGYPYLEGLAISDFLIDIGILVLPLVNISTLHLTTARKIAVFGIFLFALVGLVASTIRMVLFIKLLLLGQAANAENDPYLTNTETNFLYIMEAGMSLIAVNLPSLWYFHSKVRAESILRSIRSIGSLRSGSSVSSDNASDIEKARSNQRMHSDSSRNALSYPGDAELNADAEPTLTSERTVSQSNMGPDEIKVTTNFNQTDEKAQ